MSLRHSHRPCLHALELRAVRRNLEWTAKRMAEELGMSETYVGQMERGQKPIETRTAVAARSLALAPVVMVPRMKLGKQTDPH
ncbi:helix-turn-helix domain-containing protein [Sphingobium sp. B2D3B]|uniref:helix-turn-helix domain-containing protein n=1 Tax=Sphingobium sp. B2D3B TaxID=2940580 RepID=UPI0039B6D8FD